MRIGFYILFFLITSSKCHAQADSVLQSLQQLPEKYINKIDSKIEKYGDRINKKTEKTLEKLSRWENKLHGLLKKVNPAAAEKLFGNNQTTFASLLQKIKEGKTIAENYHAKFDDYKDKLTSSFKYLEQQKEELKGKLVQPIRAVNKKITELEGYVKNSEALEQFIKERKKQLLEQSFQYIGKSKYFTKINKEAYYYAATLRNYKEIFSDKTKLEQTALAILNKIPAFQDFIKKNSLLTSFFRFPSAGGGTAQAIAGLQIRASVSAMIQDRISSSGPNAQQMLMQKIQVAQAELGKLKDKIIKAGGNGSDEEFPDFKPNQTKTKTFKQRIELGSNLQFGKNNSLMPATADIAMSAGYKLNDKSMIGIGASYKLGLGSIQRIRLSNEGIGLRSYLDWKLKKQFYISGGYEMNYLTKLPIASSTPLRVVDRGNGWQQAALFGLSKKINIKTKWLKATKLSLLYDLLAREHVPISQPVVFRVGYVF